MAITGQAWKCLCTVLMPVSNLLFGAINISVQLFDTCLYKLTSSHSITFLKEHSSVKNWRGNDEWKTSLFLTSYNQIIIWSSILYSAFDMIVLQEKEANIEWTLTNNITIQIEISCLLTNRCWIIRNDCYQHC